MTRVHKHLQFSRLLTTWSLSIGALLAPLLASAGVEFTPDLMGNVVHHSNVFALPDGDERDPADGGASTRSDTLLSGGLGLSAKSSFGNQSFTLTGFGIRTVYDNFSELDHNEYGVDGTLLWNLTSRLSGEIGYNFQQTMVPFAATEEATSTLMLAKTNDTYGGINIEINTEWHLNSEGRHSIQKSPRPGAPGLQLEQSFATIELKNDSPGRLGFGIGSTYVKGAATGLQGTSDQDFTQRTAFLAADFEVSGQSSLQGNIGYTQRDNLQTGDVEDFIGKIHYNRQLSGKSSLLIQFDRTIANYLIDTTLRTELSHGLTIGGTWQVTPKTGFNLQGMRRRSAFPDAPIYEGGPNRADNFSILNFDMNWQVTKRLLIRPFLQIMYRDSNNPQLSFRDNMVGIEFFAGPEPWSALLRQFSRAN